jgi:O-acetyl-ADP-ribose deacetylase (regulator of RNase III)
LAKHVIHAVGPTYIDGQSAEPETLHATYISALQLAKVHNVEFIAFPCISAGVFGFPGEDACKIATQAVTGWLQEERLPRCVTFCCHNPVDEQLYRRQLTKLGVELS